jgi:hypothetical protein
VVLLDYDKLVCGLGAARLDTGEAISASLARRLACEAGIIPTVYRRVVGGRSVVLDMGRRARLHTEHQRIALDVEQGGCATERCDRPSGWCHAHHEVPWSQGGGTSVENGRLLCPFHHRKADRDRYETHALPNGKLPSIGGPDGPPRGLRRPEEPHQTAAPDSGPETQDRERL